MARGAKIVITVNRSRNFSSTTLRTHGVYGALSTNSISIDTPSLPLYTTASEKAFWQAILTEAQAQLAALP